MLSSQTKDTVTAVAMRRLQTELPHPGLTLETIIDVSPEKLNELIWAVGFHNNKTRYIKATALILRDVWASDIPDTIEGMTSLPGVGPKMAYLCMSAAWGRTEGIGVDVHVHRITNLWGWHKTKTPEETRMALQAWLPKDKWHEINHLLVGFGQTICLPVGRKCGECSLSEMGLCPSAVTVRKSKSMTSVVKSKVEIKCEEAGVETVEDRVETVEMMEAVVGEEDTKDLANVVGNDENVVEMVDTVVAEDDVKISSNEVGYNEDTGDNIGEISEPGIGGVDRTTTPTRFEAEEPPKTSISQLPNELLLQIFNYSPKPTLKAARLTCKHWHHLVPPENLFNKILISKSRQDILYLNELSEHAVYSKCVKKLTTAPSRYGDQWPASIDKRKDRQNAKSGLYLGEVGFHMAPDTLQHIAIGFSNIETLELDVLVLGDETQNSEALSALSTALGSLRNLRVLHIEVGMTHDRERTERPLLSDVVKSHVWPRLEGLTLGGLCGPGMSFCDLVIRHKPTIGYLGLCNLKLLDTEWPLVFSGITYRVGFIPILYTSPLLDHDGSDISRRFFSASAPPPARGMVPESHRSGRHGFFG